jgi:lactoylglutathione lyase
VPDPLLLLTSGYPYSRAVRIEHVALWTRDLERLRTFYEHYLGARAGARYVNDANAFASYFLTFESGARLELMRMDSIPETRDDPLEQATGLVHIAFSVGSEEAVDELTARLAVDGHRVLDGPRRTGDDYYESVVLDPDGNRVEITV